MGEPCEGKYIEVARKAHPMFEIFFDWMVSVQAETKSLPRQREQGTDIPGTLLRISTQVRSLRNV
jgi:hypothetical protein